MEKVKLIETSRCSLTHTGELKFTNDDDDRAL